MVKKYDYTVEPSATVLLNTECPKNTEISEDELIERCFSLARTVCETLEERGIHYNFVTNATAAGATGSWSSIGDGLGPVHLESILTGLGRATYAHTSPFETVLERTAQSATASTSYIVVTPAMQAQYERGVARLHEVSGMDVFLVNASDKEASEWK